MRRGALVLAWLLAALGGCGPSGSVEYTSSGGGGGDPLRNASPRVAESRAAPAAVTPSASAAGPDAASPSDAALPALPASVTRLRLALTPYLAEDELRQSYEPLRAWLEASTGVPVTLSVAPTYDALADQLVAGTVDLVEFSPYAWVRALEGERALTPVVAKIADGSILSSGYIVVREETALVRLEQLRARKVAFVDRASASGWLMPYDLFLLKGLKPRGDLGGVVFLGNHEAVLQAVHDGTVDAGAVYSGALGVFMRRHGIPAHRFRVIGKTARMPRDVLAVSANAPEGLAEALRARLLPLNVLSAEGRRALSATGANGYIPVEDGAYEVLRAAARRVANAEEDAGVTVQGAGAP